MVLALSQLLATCGRAEDVFWTNPGGGNWNVAGNWGAGRVPVGEDHAFITLAGSYTVALGSVAEVGALTVGGDSGTQTLNFSNSAFQISGPMEIREHGVLAINGGVINSTNEVTLRGAATWTAGVMSGTGRTVVAPGATLTISGGSTKSMDAGRVLENRGAVVWSGGGINLNSSGVGGSGRIENASTGVFEIALTGGSIMAPRFADVDSDPLPGFHNAGIVKKSGSDSETNIAVPFSNTGTVTVDVGTLRLTGGGSNAGTMNLAAGATLAPQTLGFATGSMLTGEGIFLFDSGTQTISADQGVPNLLMMGGTLAGGASLTVTGAATWTAGVMSGTGRTVVAPGATLTISGGSAKSMDAGRVLENRGVVVWSGGSINLNSSGEGGSGRIENASTGIFEIALSGGSVSAPAFADINSDPRPGFHNAGVLKKSGSDSETTLAVPFSNSGTVAVDIGALRLTGGGSNAGTMNLAAGATLAPQTLDFATGSMLTGEGIFLFDSGTQTISADQGIPNLSMTGGTLAGGASLTVTGAATWTAGVMSGSGRTVVAPGATLTISGGSAKSMDAGRLLENRGAVVWSGGSINLNSSGEVGSGRIENASTGLFEIAITGGSVSASAFADLNSEPRPGFHNAGVLKKSGSDSETALAVPFSNTGTVAVDIGTLRLLGGGSNAGTMKLAAGATLAPQTLGFATGSMLTGEGLFLFDSGTQTISADQGIPNLSMTGGALAGGASLTVTAAATWTAGVMSGSGRTVVAPGATLTISGGSVKSMDAGRVLENRGIVVWSGGGINLNNSGEVGSGRIENAITGVFEIALTGGFVSASAFADLNSDPRPAFHNAGILRTSVSNSENSIAVPFSNTGTVQLLRGTLNASGPVTLSPEGTLRFVIGGTSTASDFGRFHASGTLELDGTIDLVLANAFEPDDGRRFNLISAGTLTGTFDKMLGTVLPNQLFFSPDQRLRELIIVTKNGHPTLEARAGAAISQFRIRGIPDQLYRIYTSPDLSVGRWMLIHTFTMPGSGFLDFIDPEAENHRQRYYTAEFVPADL